ncbi:MAG TPA: hypothetical protein DGT23_23995 [Micromonosporaceae bacterium]|nr:hypothetical protein [Micromonosporaceae bacterium]
MHFVSGDITRDAVVEQSGRARPGQAEDARDRRLVITEIYASAAGDDALIAELKAAGFPATLKEALGDQRLAGETLPDWPHALPSPGQLPGESAPLTFAAGRKAPVTPEEALGIARRRRRRELIEKYAATVGDPAKLAALMAAGAPRTVAQALADPDQLPAELPPWTASKTLANLRFPPAAKARADAAAELADSNFTTMTELLWWRYLKQRPLSPLEVEDLTAEYLAETLGADLAADRAAERSTDQFRPRKR